MGAIRRYVIGSAFVLSIFYLGCFSHAGSALNSKESVRTYYLRKLDTLDTALAALASALDTKADAATTQQKFREARERYKAIELFAEYYHSMIVRSLNGPPRPESLSDEESTPTPPIGFQVIEPWLFPKLATEHFNEATAQIKDMRAHLKNIASTVAAAVFDDAQTFDAVRLEVFRVIALGITGFDCPLAKTGISESAVALRSCAEVVSFYGEGVATRDSLLALIAAASSYCTSHPDFDTFDRAEFITVYANPLCRSLVLLRTELHIDVPKKDKRLLLPPTAVTLFSAELDPLAYAPSYQTAGTPAKIALGRMLFFDPALSANGKRACASCHDPKQAFTDGNAKSTAFDFEGTVDRNSPTILNAALQREYFYDSRVIFLEDQITAVVNSHKEFRNTFDHIVETLSASPEYQKLFTEAFGTPTSLKSENVRTAIACYVRSLVSLNSRFDEYMRGRATLTASEKHGFNLFAGKAQCATCHFLPLFNGTTPPKFEETDWEVLGVPSKADTVGITLDPDEGRYARFQTLPMEHHGFKTPTLRNIAVTAPYMHNGAYKTLEQVLDFYNHGGGVGLGLQVPNQTLSSDPLHLSKDDMQDIIAFLHTLTDSSYLKMQAPTTLPELSSKGYAARKIGGVY